MLVWFVFGIAVFFTAVLVAAATWPEALFWLSCAWKARRASRHLDAEWLNERANSR